MSQRVKALEQQLGRVLVVRSKPVRATEAGAPIVRLARQVALLEHDALAEFGLDEASARPISLALAVNADSLATWFLPALARVGERHPVVFDLHRDDQDFTAGLLESGTVLGAVTSQSAPVAGCLVRPARRHALRGRGDARLRRALGARAQGGPAAALAAAPLVDFDRRDDLQREHLSARGIDPDGPPRHFVPASSDFATAVKLGLGWGMLPAFQSAENSSAARSCGSTGAPIDVPLYWQQWNLRSSVLTAVADELAVEARTALARP